MGGAGLPARRGDRGARGTRRTWRSAGWTGRSTRNGRSSRSTTRARRRRSCPPRRPPRTRPRCCPSTTPGSRPARARAPGRTTTTSRPSSPSTRSATRSTDARSAATTCTRQLRKRLPDELLPWCDGCQSHHARRGLLIMAGLHGRLCISGRVGRQPEFSRTDQLIEWERAEPRGGRARSSCKRYRHLYGELEPPALHRVVGPGQAARAGAVGAEPREGRRRELPRACGCSAPAIPSCSAPRPRDARAGRGVAEAGVEGGRRRRRGHAGREAVALWRGRKQGKTLEVTVEGGDVDVQAQADRLAPHRGCSKAVVQK